MARRRFSSKRTAKSFAKRVNGKVNDLRGVPEAKSRFTVTYDHSEKQRLARERSEPKHNDWAPEEDRDFGYPNEYWK